MTSSNSYSSPIVRAKPQYLKKAPSLSYRASLNPFAETSPWQSRLSSPRITVRNTSPIILHPLQIPWQASSSSTEPRHHRVLLTADPIHRGNSLFTVLLHNQGYPKVCPDPLNLSTAGDPFAGTSSLSFCSLFSPTRDLIASI
jgi:hypothetical protein